MSQNASKTDLRVRRTRKVLRDALVKLLATQDFEAITVGDIAEQAMINRATFYRHFRDKKDLLEHGMDDVLEQMGTRLSAPLLETGDLNFDATEVNLKLLLSHVAEHADFYQVVLGQSNEAGFGNGLRDHLRQVIANRWQSIVKIQKMQPVMQIDLILDFYTSAYIGALSWWVKQGCLEPIEQMVQHLLVLTTSTIYSALGVETPDDVEDAK